MPNVLLELLVFYDLLIALKIIRKQMTNGFKQQ